MRLNENTKIIGKRVILVPYEAKHVEKYHEWMKSPELQQLTASEPLSLEEEYDMQRSWRQDDDKLTFLVLCRQKYEEASAGGEGRAEDRNEIDSLVGDTNLFLRDDEDEEETATATRLVGEAEIMIADHEARGKGYGWEAMLLLFKYATQNLSIRKFVAKIGFDNEKSLRMFEKMRFEEVARSEVFREATLERAVNENWVHWLDSEVTLQCEQYGSLEEINAVQ